MAARSLASASFWFHFVWFMLLDAGEADRLCLTGILHESTGPLLYLQVTISGASSLFEKRRGWITPHEDISDIFRERLLGASSSFDKLVSRAVQGYFK